MNGFYREGEYWTLAFNGEVARLRASRGLLLLSRLMERPGRELHVLDLAELRGGDADRTEAVLDGTARHAFRDRIVELEADLNEADTFGDSERSALARAELDAVVDELARATGLSGRDRRSASNSERARVAATRAIRSALERISQALPDLGRHLRQSVRTGTYCVYAPDPTRTIDWQLIAPQSEAATLHAPMPARLAIEVETSRGFVGRVAERRMLEEAWSSVPPARPVVVLVAGEPGIGKTRLVAEFAATANRDGALVGYGWCDEELAAPYGPFSVALGHVVELASLTLLEAHVAQHGAEVAAIAPALLHRVSRAGDRSTNIGADRARLFGAVSSLLNDLSREVPLILIVDDLQWADGPSLALFRHLAKTDCGHLLLVGTYRATDVSRSHPLVGLLAALRRDPGVSRVHLEGLSPGEVDELAGGAGVDVGGAGSLYERTGGNPFFATEVLQSIQESDVGVPTGVRETVVDRVARLADPAPGILRLAAVLGREFRLDVLTAVADVDIETVLDAVDCGVSAGLVAEMPDEISRFGFVHALIREALYEDMSRSRRAQLHLRAAEAVAQTIPDDLRSRAHHFAMSPMPGGADQAVEYSRRAADQAWQLYAYEEASLLARQALRLAEAHLAGDERLLADLLVLLGRSEIGDGRPEAGKASLRRALAIGRELESSGLLADVALAFGSLSIATTRTEIDEPVRVLREAIAARDDRDDAQHVRLLCALTRWLSFVAPRSERLELEGRALAMARRLGDDALIADSLIAALYNRSGPADAADQRTMADELELLARRSGDEEKRVIAVLYRAFGLLQQGHHDLAAEAEDEFLAAAKPLSQPFFVLYSIAIAGRRACVAGDFAAAERRASDMRNAAAKAGWDNEAPTGMQADQLWACWYLQGRFDKLASLTSADDEPNATLALVRRAVVALERPGATLDPQELSTVRELMDDEGSFDWWSYVAPLLVHLCARLADRGRALALYAKLLPWAHLDFVNEVQAFHGSVQHHLGVLAATGGRWPAAVEHFTTAVDRHNAAGSPPWVAITTAELARAIEQRDAPGDAQLCLTLRRSAREAAAALGVHLHDDQANPVRP